MDKKETATTDTTEQRIFDAAHEVFVQKGLDGTKMQEIADRAGINKALLHYYYRSKEKLYEMVAKGVISRAIPVIRQTLESDLPLKEKIEAFIDFYINLISKNTFVPMFILGEVNKHPQYFVEHILPKDLPQPQKFLQQLETEIAAGHIRPIRPEHLVVNIVSMCVFPFLAKPMAAIILGMPEEEIKAFLLERKTAVKDFVFAALRPDPTA